MQTNREALLGLGKIERILAELSPGEKLHVLRLGDAPPGGLPRKSGWKARPVMVKGLSDWADYQAGTECLTDLGWSVLAALKARAHKEPDHG